VSPRADFDAMEKRKLTPQIGIELLSLSFQAAL